MIVPDTKIDELIKLSQVLLMEEGKTDINNIANLMLRILYDIKDNKSFSVSRKYE